MPSAMYFFFRISCLLLQALNETVMAITAIVVRSTDMRLKARPGYIIRWLILLLISSFLCDAVQQFPCSLNAFVVGLLDPCYFCFFCIQILHDRLMFHIRVIDLECVHPFGHGIIGRIDRKSVM